MLRFMLRLNFADVKAEVPLSFIPYLLIFIQIFSRIFISSFLLLHSFHIQPLILCCATSNGILTIRSARLGCAAGCGVGHPAVLVLH